MFPMAFGAISCGVLFGALNIGSARNPDEHDKLYSTSLTAFALIETFVLLGLVVAGLLSILF
jgi:F0F1-type ATP synthase membrane subunit c/vacuolar-type H+-ATPase subunit K